MELTSRAPRKDAKRVWVKCVTRTRVGKPALGFDESLKNIYSSKINAVKTQKYLVIRLNSYKLPKQYVHSIYL